MKNYTVLEECILIDFLKEELKYSHKEAKKKLMNGQIIINNKVITKYNFPLKKANTVTINNFDSKVTDDISIIYEDKNIIVVNKPANLLTISTVKEKEKTLYYMVSDYLKKKNKNSKVFVIHRLDKETSGIVMFAKSENIKSMYQNNWETLVKYRGYVAVVSGVLEKKEDTITQYLTENDKFMVYETNMKNGKKAVTYYKVTKQNQNYSLLDIEIKTGRKNQIRVAMKSIGHSVLGDIKYGSLDKSLKRMGLCANKLIITNPITNKDFTFEIKIPSSFIKIVR